MGKKRRQYDANLKARVSLEAIKGEKTLAQLSSDYQVHANQIVKWKKKVLQELPQIFSTKKKQEGLDQQRKIDELYRQIGQLTVELDWVKKKADLFS